jgi:GNAT superfamily N-acetyltransferase
MDRMDPESLDEPRVHRAGGSDWTALARIDSVAAAGDRARVAGVRGWCADSVVLVAEGASGPLGYGVLEYTFFEQGFLTMLMIAPGARRRGVGARLLAAVEPPAPPRELFTSTDVSNVPMQQSLRHADRRPAGLVHGLDEGDPELFYLCPGDRLRVAAGTAG